MADRDFFRAIGGWDESASRIVGSDFATALRLAEHAPLGVLHAPLVGIRRHDGNFSADTVAMNLGDARILEQVLASRPGLAPLADAIRASIAATPARRAGRCLRAPRLRRGAGDRRHCSTGRPARRGSSATWPPCRRRCARRWWPSCSPPARCAGGCAGVPDAIGRRSAPFAATERVTMAFSGAARHVRGDGGGRSAAWLRRTGVTRGAPGNSSVTRPKPTGGPHAGLSSAESRGHRRSDAGGGAGAGAAARPGEAAHARLVAELPRPDGGDRPLRRRRHEARPDPALGRCGRGGRGRPRGAARPAGRPRLPDLHAGLARRRGDGGGAPARARRRHRRRAGRIRGGGPGGPGAGPRASFLRGGGDAALCRRHRLERAVRRAGAAAGRDGAGARQRRCVGVRAAVGTRRRGAGDRHLLLPTPSWRGCARSARRTASTTARRRNGRRRCAR